MEVEPRLDSNKERIETIRARMKELSQELGSTFDAPAPSEDFDFGKALDDAREIMDEGHKLMKELEALEKSDK